MRWKCLGLDGGISFFKFDTLDGDKKHGMMDEEQGQERFGGSIYVGYWLTDGVGVVGWLVLAIVDFGLGDNEKWINVRDLHFCCLVVGVICTCLLDVTALCLKQRASAISGHSQWCAMRFRWGAPCMKTSLYLVVRARKAHGIPPPGVHTALLHLTAEVFDSVAFEQAGAFHLLSVWSVLAVHWGGARDELVIFVSQILGQLLDLTDQAMVLGLFD
jgi:hypothetical protein